MSDEPISVDKALGLRQAMDAGWSEAEVQWEGLQEAAAELAEARALDKAASLWGDALFLARQNFASPLVAIPCAISAVFHSLIGSLVAALWRRSAEELGRR